MCQPKPGPRCAAHSRAALTRARAAKTAADATFEEAKTALRASRRVQTGYRHDPGTTDEALAYQAAFDAKSTADRAFEAAKRDYETTPSGQRALAEAVERLAADGDVAGAAAARQRLAEAVETRAQQVTSLAAARVQGQRLTRLSDAERMTLAERDGAVFASEATVASFEADVTAAKQTLAAVEERFAPVQAEYHAAMTGVRQAEREVLAAQEQARNQARRLYLDAGVADRYAGFYADDTIEAAINAGQRIPSGGAGQPGTAQRPLALKVKRTGPDAATTAAAKTASSTDERFQAANTALADKISALQTARTVQQDAQQGSYRRLFLQRSEAITGVTLAERRLTEARTDHATVVGRADRMRAQIAANAGTRATSVDLQRATDEIVRQPDGTTNAYVYRQPSTGFPHGRYVRATGVTTVQGMGAANALTLEDGDTAHVQETYGRGLHGARTSRTAPIEVIVIPPAEGSRPLRAEAVAGAGFSTFIDSTD